MNPFYHHNVCKKKQKSRKKTTKKKTPDIKKKTPDIEYSKRLIEYLNSLDTEHEHVMFENMNRIVSFKIV